MSCRVRFLQTYKLRWLFFVFVVDGIRGTVRGLRGDGAHARRARLTRVTTHFRSSQCVFLITQFYSFSLSYVYRSG